MTAAEILALLFGMKTPCCYPCSSTGWCCGVSLDRLLPAACVCSVLLFMSVCPEEKLSKHPSQSTCRVSADERADRFPCGVYLPPSSAEMTEEEPITGASSAKQMCNYENRGLRLACSLPVRRSCNAQCNPNPQTAN